MMTRLILTMVAAAYLVCATAIPGLAQDNLRVSVASSPTAATVSPDEAPVASPQASRPRFGGDSSEPVGHRRFGVGLANIGPSVRYWMDATKGIQVDGYFSSSFGYSVSAISPSFISRFGTPKQSGSITVLPYWGAGVTLWHFDQGYFDYYCSVYATGCSSTSLGFGGFVGGEMAFESLPKLTISGNAGYYTARLGYGGFAIGVGVHYYPGAK
jgi:hypothetical protein